MSDVVTVFFVELVIGHGREALAPKDHSFLDRETNALENHG